MIIGAGSGIGVDLALREQLLALDRVAARLILARTVLPAADGGGVWRGDARRMYIYALQQLSSQVQAACMHVDEASRDTRRALASLIGGSYGG